MESDSELNSPLLFSPHSEVLEKPGNERCSTIAQLETVIDQGDDFFASGGRPLAYYAPVGHVLSRIDCPICALLSNFIRRHPGFQGG
jgi:hypothetical protein